MSAKRKDNALYKVYYRIYHCGKGLLVLFIIFFWALALQSVGDKEMHFYTKRAILFPRRQRIYVAFGVWRTVD